jgi:hypothetical protein
VPDDPIERIAGSGLLEFCEGFLVTPENFRRLGRRIEDRRGWIGDDLGADFVKTSGSL